MYQFDRSSTKLSNDATTSGVQKRSYASVASATSCSTREEPAVERLEVTGFAGGRDVRVVDEELRAVPECQQPPPDLVRRPVTEVEVLTGDLLEYIQRITAPIRSIASLASIAFPVDLCISRPTRHGRARRQAHAGTGSGRSG